MKCFLFFSVFFLSFNSFNAFADTESQHTNNQTPSIICSPTECYTIIKVLGEGAFGKVYAVENSSGMPYAIKTYKNSLDSSPSSLNNLYTDAQREFSRGQLLNHPNIIKSHDLFMSDSEDGIANIVLDLVNGRVLFETERGDIGYLDSLKANLQFIDAIQYALSLDLMHLDLHGGNLMLDNQSNLMVIDLASFFTLEEVQNFLYNEIYPSSTESESTTVVESKSLISKGKKSSPTFALASLSKAVTVLPTKKHSQPSILPMAPLRLAKLEKFFNENPKVVEKIKESLQEKEALSSIKNRNIDFSRSVSKLSSTKSVSATTLDASQIDLTPMQARYFDRITEICSKLISKSNTNREEKIEMRANIKKIAWNYEEDMEDGTCLPLTTYLDLLMQALQSN